MLRVLAPIVRVLTVMFVCIAPCTAAAAALELWATSGIVGSRFTYEVRERDTVVSISARYAVSERALIRDNGLKPPYRLRPGDRLHVHNRHVAPESLAEGIVINVPQRLLFVFRAGRLVGAYAVALGRPDWRTPTGSYFVRALEQDKPWIVPPSIQEEMREQGRPVLRRVEPGPGNPLGRYWIGLSLPGYGIHGTNAPSSIYRMRTHGCIRVHPDDIELLYAQASLNMPVKIVYAHTLMARLADGRLVAEANPDVYNHGGNPLDLLREQARGQRLEDNIDWTLAARVAKARMGQAFEIGHAAAHGAQPGVAAGAEVRLISLRSAGCDGGVR